MIEDRSLGLNAPGESKVEQRYRSERGKDGRHIFNFVEMKVLKFL